MDIRKPISIFYDRLFYFTKASVFSGVQYIASQVYQDKRTKKI